VQHQAQLCYAYSDVRRLNVMHLVLLSQTNFSHNGDDGSDASQRLNRYGTWFRGHGESLAFLHTCTSGKPCVPVRVWYPVSCACVYTPSPERHTPITQLKTSS